MVLRCQGFRVEGVAALGGYSPTRVKRVSGMVDKSGQLQPLLFSPTSLRIGVEY